MTNIRRLTDSCVLVTDDQEATLFDPGFHTFLEGFDLDSIGDVTRVLITHEHGDHVHPDFLKWLIDRRSDLAVYGNEPVVDLLSKHDVEASNSSPVGVTAEDVLHGIIPNGAQPPNRSWTIDGVFTHPGDSREPGMSAPILALPLMVPWDSATGAVQHAKSLAPAQVVPIHDFYMSAGGRKWIRGMVQNVLAESDIELVDLDWGDSYTV